MKFLIIRFSSIGDIILTTPVIRCLKLQKPDSEIHFLTKATYSSILKSNPYLQKVYSINKSISEVLPSLRVENYHYIIDLHHNLRTIILKASLLKISYSFDKINLEKWIAVNLKINILPKIHIVDRYIYTLQAFGIKNDQKGLDYFIPPNEEVDFSLIPSTHRENFIAFAIGGSYNTKKLPVEQIIKICQRIQKPVFLLGGNEERLVGDEVFTAVGNKVYNGCGKFTLHESASIIQKSFAVITHDTGLMHISAAFQKNTVSIWGNTIPEFGMYPYMPGEQSLIVEVENLSCRPCSKLGYNSCPKKHFNCMKNIDFHLVVDYINNL